MKFYYIALNDFINEIKKGDRLLPSECGTYYTNERTGEKYVNPQNATKVKYERRNFNKELQ